MLWSSSLVPGSTGGAAGALVSRADGARGCVAGCCTFAPLRCLPSSETLSTPAGAASPTNTGTLSAPEGSACERLRASRREARAEVCCPAVLATSSVTPTLCSAAASYVRLCVRCCWVLGAAEVCAPALTAAIPLCSGVSSVITAAATSYVRLCANGSASVTSVCVPNMRRDRAAKSTNPGCRVGKAGAG